MPAVARSNLCSSNFIFFYYRLFIYCGLCRSYFFFFFYFIADFFLFIADYAVVFRLENGIRK